MAKVLKASGREEAAKKILIAKNKARLKLAKLNLFDRLKLLFLWVTLGFGYRTWYAACWALIAIVLGVFVFQAGYGNQIFSSCTKDINQSFNAIIYSVDKFVPLLDLDHAKHWQPGKDKKGVWDLGWLGSINLTGNGLTIYIAIHTFVGWVLTTIFIVGLTGVIKQ